MLGTTLHHRFRLEQVLHRAASGPLYLATDERSGEMLALKCFPPGTDFAGQDGLRYRRAMERLAGLTHPHLLSPRHTGVAQDVAFQVLPYFPGDDLDTVLADGPLAPAQGLALLRQAAQGLAALHGAGLLHGNLKPANVLLARTDGALQAVLCDPLRPLLGDEAAAALRDAAWCAPERVPWLGLPADPRSDLYALGALAFRALTGSPPFDAATAAEVLHQHVVARPPDPLQCNPALPAGLAAVLARLLAKHPRDRYPSAQALLSDLDALEAGGSSGLPAPTEPPDPLDAFQRSFGRDAARDTLLAALARAQAGQGTLLWLSGEPGSGRHALVRDLLPHAEAARALVLRVRVPPPEACAPLQVPAALLRALLARWETLGDTRRHDLLQRLHGALGSQAGVLTGLVPELRTLLPQAADPAPLPLGRERLRTLHGLCEALLALADARHPLVLWLEEVQSADPDSREWLTLLARRLGGAPVLVLAATTSQAEPFPSPPESATGHPADPAGPRYPVQTLALRPLAEPQVVAWLADALGWPVAPADASADGTEGPAARLARWMTGRWGGHPLTLRLGLHLLLARGLLRPAERGCWACEWEALERGAWPESLPALVQHRLELLPDDLLPVLHAVAAAPEGRTFDELGALLEHLPPPLLLERVEAAIAEGVLEREDGRLRFAHDRLREAAWRGCPPQRQEELHALLGATLEARGDLPPLQRHLRAAYHFRQAGDERWVVHGCRLVDEATHQQALRAVAHWVERLRPRLPQDAQLAALLMAGGIAQVQVGQPEAALALLEAARGLGLPETAELEAIACSAWAERMRGRTDEALALVEAGLSFAGEALPAHPVGTALARLGGAAARRYEGLRHAALGEAQAPLSGRERRVTELLGLASLLLAADQPARAALADERILRLAGPRAPSPQLVAALVRLGEGDGDPDGAPFVQARTLLERHDFPHVQAALHAAQGRCRLAAGRWRSAGESLGAALEGFRRLGALPDEAETLRACVELTRLQGPLPRLRQAVGALRDLCATVGEAGPLATAEGLAAHAAALEGTLAPARAGEALRQAAQRLGVLERGGEACHLLALAADLALVTDDLGGWLAAVRCEADLPPAPESYGAGLLLAVRAEGHAVQAAALPEERAHHLQPMQALLRELHQAPGQGPVLRADLARAEVLAHLAAGAPGPALELAEAALAALEGEGLPLAAAELRRAVAAGLKAAGRDDWMRWGGAALTGFDALQAPLYLQATRRLLELEAAPLDGPSRRASDADGGADSGGSLDLQPAGQTVSLLALLERMETGRLPDQDALQAELLAALRQAGDAEHAAWFAPNGDGQLACVRTLPERCGSEPFNQWLAEQVWQDARADVLAHYRPPTGEDGAAARGQALPEARSLLALPLRAGGRLRAVVQLSSAASRHVYDAAQAVALAPAGRAAGALLALNARLRAADDEAQRQAADAQRHQHLLRWAARAAETQRLESLLAAWCTEIAAPRGCLGAVLCLKEDESLRLGAAWGALPDAGALARWFPLPLLPGQAETALARCAPLAGTALDAPPAGAPEQALLAALGGGTALWLPLLREGAGFGLVLALFEPAALPAGQALDAALGEPLNLLAPAIHAAWRADADRAALALAQARADGLERATGLYRRLLPPAAPREAEALAAALEDGVERTLPVLVGKLPAAGFRMSSGTAGDAAWSLPRHYVAQLHHGLALHQGALERLEERRWVATYPAGVDGALWGAQTLYQLLLELREGTADGGPALPPTGLGLHCGQVQWAALPAGEALLPLLGGAAIGTAARLAAMSIALRCGILVSQHTVRALEHPDRFDLRPLGRLRPMQGEPRTEVFELYSVREPDVVAPMRSLQPVWAEALLDFQRGRWRSAAGGFGHYARALPQDRPARYFLRRCRLRAQG